MKTKGITKYDIDWQVARVSFRKVKGHLNKAMGAIDFLLEHPTVADKERVLNYLDGLAMAYKGADREDIHNAKLEAKQIEVSNENRVSLDFSKYDDKTLKGVVKDLMARNSKWLKKGYRHEEQNAFLRALIDHLNDEETSAKLESEYEDSKYKDNTHNFFF